MKLSFSASILVSIAGINAASAAVLGQGYFEGNYYKVYDTTGTFYQADAAAKGESFTCSNGKTVTGMLAEPDSQAENQYIAGLLPDSSSALPWIGITDLGVEGQFKFLSDGSAVTEFFWHSGEPNDAGTGEDCVHLGWFSDDQYWNDYFCDRTAQGYAVEFDCSSPGINGDPHIKTWSGEMYDFHGACDLVMLENAAYDNGRGMNIHIRTKFTGYWSYIASAVVQIGDDTFEVQGGSDAQYWLNGVQSDDLSKGIDGHAITFSQVNSKSMEFVIALGNNGQGISIKTWKSFVRVDLLAPTADDFASSLGLLGSFGAGNKIGRDGSTVFEDNIAFGLEWQVLPEEPKLFHNMEGVQAPEKCALPDASKGRRRLGELTITLEDAQQACSRVTAGVDYDACVFDVLATNDKDMAGAY